MSETEVITPEAAARADLSALADGINETIDLIHKHEGAFEEATLEPRLLIGQRIAAAQAQFALSTTDRTAPATLSRMTTSAEPTVPQGFSAWLQREIPRLKRPRAYKYAAAFLGLGVPADATPGQITERIKKLRHDAGKANLPMPSLASLYKAAPKPEKTSEPLQIEEPKDTAQLRLEDARETFHTWRQTFETAVERGQLDDLDRTGLEEMKEFLLSARDRINNRLK